MLRSLESVIRYIVESDWSNHYCYDRDYRANYPTFFMDIPVDKEEFEIPAFALDSCYNRKLINPDLAKIVAFTGSHHTASDYSSTDALVRHVLNEAFPNSGLVLLRVKDKGNVTPFFGTFGALFYPDGIPMMMFTWKVRYKRDADEPFQLLRPLLRINPKCYKKNNPLEKYVLSKIVPICLYNDFDIHFSIGGTSVTNEIEYENPLVLFENPPFRIRRVKMPSIDTENQELLDIAYEYFDDIAI